MSTSGVQNKRSYLNYHTKRWKSYRRSMLIKSLAMRFCSTRIESWSKKRSSHLITLWKSLSKSAGVLRIRHVVSCNSRMLPCASSLKFERERNAQSFLISWRSIRNRNMNQMPRSGSKGSSWCFTREKKLTIRLKTKSSVCSCQTLIEFKNS